MNTKALAHYLQNETDASFHRAEDDSFVVYERRLSNDLLGEIVACGGCIEDSDMYRAFRIVSDEDD